MGEDLNGHSGNMGLGLQLMPLDTFSFNIGYDMYLADHYLGHQVSAMFQLEF